MYQEQSSDQISHDLTPAFVVGTGRCGSTMISTMLNAHPAILSLSELFSLVTDLWSLIPQAFPEGSIDAAHFWKILSTAYSKQNILRRHGLATDEALYPCDSNSRFNAESGIPALMQITLPHLTHEHERLFDEVQAVIESFPPAAIQQHYERLFAWLCWRFHRQVWVDRSGASLESVGQLHQLFPQAKFVHIVRDGRDCAISMSRHNAFRLGMALSQIIKVLGYDPFEVQERSGVEKLSDELSAFLPENFHADVLRYYHVPPTVTGYYWSEQIVAGLHALSQLPSQQVLTIRYEDFQTDAETVIRNFITFIDPMLVDETWIKTAASMVRPATSSWRTMQPHEQEALEAACRAGCDALSALNMQ